MMVSETTAAPTMRQTMEGKSKAHKVYLAVKRIFDFIAAALGLIILSPLLLLIALLVKCEDGGAIIHKRRCVADGGKHYYMYKFRSMVPDADILENYLTPAQIEEYLKEVKLDDDPRITRIGKLIRKTSIDELLQLFNVVKGDMSLVGPRPLTEGELCHFGDRAGEILSVKPGITGYWQVNSRSDSTYESGKRQELELYYAQHQCLLLDVKILFQTVLVVLRGVGAK